MDLIYLNQIKSNPRIGIEIKARKLKYTEINMITKIQAKMETFINKNTKITTKKNFLIKKDKQHKQNKVKFLNSISVIDRGTGKGILIKEEIILVKGMGELSQLGAEEEIVKNFSAYKERVIMNSPWQDGKSKILNPLVKDKKNKDRKIILKNFGRHL